MEHVAAVKQALDYIECNLREELSAEDVARAVHFSASHFHAIFPKVTGCTLAEHMRRRRLACAALDLALSRRRILDIALEYRFDSQEAFTRAFKRQYGVTPGTFRHHRAYPARPIYGIYSPGDLLHRTAGEASVSSRAVVGESRLVLEGVMKVSFEVVPPRCPEDIPFPSCLASALRYMGEDFPWKPVTAHNQTWRLNWGNVGILAASGMAFGLLWRPGWHMDNTDHLFIADPREVIRRAFQWAGYAYEVVEKTGSPDDRALYWEKLRESLRRSRPVLAFGVIGPPECCLITGYDEGGEVLIGWNFFQNDPQFAGSVETEPSGYFRKRDWFRNTHSLIVIGEKTARPDPHEANRAMLRWALEVIRTPSVFGRHCGLAAYSAWASHLEEDEAFPAGAPDVLRQRHQVHMSAGLNVAECRAWAGMFLKDMAQSEPAMAEDLLAAADCYSVEHDLVWRMWALTGREHSPEAPARFADPAVRREIIPIIHEARRLDEKAAAHLERALSR